jgi:hypothetical protein
MAHDIILGRTKRDWSIGSIQPGSQGSIPSKWIEADQAEAMVQKNMKEGGLFGMKLNRQQAEDKTISYMKAQRIGIKSMAGSLLIPDKQQAAFFRKIDDIRYDVRRAGVKAGIGLLVLSASLGLIGVAGIYKASKEGPR